MNRKTHKSICEQRKKHQRNDQLSNLKLNSLHHFGDEDKRTTLYTIIPCTCGRHRCAHLEASLQINVLHWLPAAIKRDRWRARPWWIMDDAFTYTQHRMLTMKNFSHEKRASAESWKCNEGSSFIAWAALSIITGPETGEGWKGDLEASIGYWLCTGMITRSSKRTVGRVTLS